jgi:hypothetical protein
LFAWIICYTQLWAYCALVMIVPRFIMTLYQHSIICTFHLIDHSNKATRSHLAYSPCMQIP